MIKKVERACCLTLTYLPLVFVYGLTTWAVWVETSIGFEERRPRWTGTFAFLYTFVVLVKVGISRLSGFSAV